MFASHRFGLPSAFAFVVGVFLVIEGLWGLFSPVVFGALTTSILHSVMHFVLGLAGIATGMQSRPSGFLIFLGVLLLTVGVMRFMPDTSAFVVRTLAVNQPVAMVHIVVGGVALALGLAARQRY